MQTEKQKNIDLEMKRLFIIFLALTLFCGPAFSQKKDTYRVRTVVIDPGHGGAKPGAQGKHVQEKEITLSIAKKFGKLISDNYPDVKVIYTRTKDVDISLAERAHIANRNKADLFISIHANSHPTSVPSGVETFVMGLSESRANLEVARKENADILLEADYKNNADYSGFDPNAPETYVMLAMFQSAFMDKSLNFAQAIQNQYKKHIKTIDRGVKQAELYVLYKTSMPSVLTEVGFISNPTEEAYMMSAEGQATIAICLFNAFMNYKSIEDGSPRIAKPVINIDGYKASAPKTEQTKPTPTVVVDTNKVEVTKDTVEAKAPVETVREEAPVAPSTKPVPTVALVQREDTTAVEKKPIEEQKPVVNDEGLRYRVQFCTAQRVMKVGDPDLGGIKDFQYSKTSAGYAYSAGNYTTRQEAQKRCNTLKQTTRFKDAFVIAIYNGERITMDEARRIENTKKK